ncbi:hypothetical protein AAFO92_04860 [Roseovarius sp. CAU 1744]|uniref:hypothetical protein n=1 Tax=Roseovarius sp. CAU 1744 TaxID=3140368 RepID=UPI00325AB4AB
MANQIFRPAICVEDKRNGDFAGWWLCPNDGRQPFSATRMADAGTGFFEETGRENCNFPIRNFRKFRIRQSQHRLRRKRWAL